MGQLSVSAIIVNYNGGAHLRACLESLRGQQGLLEIIVVDNGSSDGSVESVAGLDTVSILRNTTNLGFAGGCNLGAQDAKGEILLFLNPDMTLESECVAILAEALKERPGVAGPAVQVEASRTLEFGGVIDIFGYPSPLNEIGRPLFVPGCAFATNSDLFRRLGGFDFRYFMFVEDVDYCWRVLLNGQEVMVPPGARGKHAGGASTPGGYAKQDGPSTPSPFRFVLRERNSLAMLLKCCSGPLLVLIVPGFIVQAIATAVVAALMGHLRVCLGILNALSWNLLQLPETLRLRGNIVRTRSSGRRLRGRIQWRSNKLLILVRQGLPRFVD